MGKWNWLATLILLSAAAFMWTREHRALLEAQRGEDDTRNVTRKQIIQHEAGRREMQSLVVELMRQNKALTATLDDARKAVAICRSAQPR